MTDSRPGSRFYPTRGPVGSIYETMDGVFYCRTPSGHAKLPTWSGICLYEFQTNMVSALRKAEGAASTALVRGGLFGTLLGALVAGALCLAA